MGFEKEREKEEGQKMETLFCSVHEFLTDAENFDVTDFLCNNSAILILLLLLLLLFLSITFLRPLLLLISKLRPMTSIGTA